MWLRNSSKKFCLFLNVPSFIKKRKFDLEICVGNKELTWQKGDNIILLASHI